MKHVISERHRKELLRFLLLQTATVRCGVKPGELLRVHHCYEGLNAEGFRFCLYRKDILEILKLHYHELQVGETSSLIFFYHPGKLTEVLNRPDNQRVLRSCGYPADATPQECLQLLCDRFAQGGIPHEVGIFVGYPAKDVVGYLANLPRTPIHKGRWAVFGNATESLSRMQLYRQVESMAKDFFDVCDNVQAFFDMVSSINVNRSMTNG